MTNQAAVIEAIRAKTRPEVAKESWRATMAYCFATMAYHMVTGDALFDIYIASVLVSPCAAFIGFRTGDKIAEFKYKWQNNGDKHEQAS